MSSVMPDMNGYSWLILARSKFCPTNKKTFHFAWVFSKYS